MNRPPAPFRLLLDLFSSVRFGIVLLSILFVYSSVGSAGILYPDLRRSLNVFDLDNWSQIVPRQWRGLEMTEFEWFHWWPFDVLIALICLTLVVTTIRRIRFKPMNYGVWMIHTGIVILAIGSVWYFTAKVEGDAPISRRDVVVSVPGREPVSMAARVGNRLRVGDHEFVVSSIDPEWELLTGEHAGDRAFAVSVNITTPVRMFVRQLLDGYPEFTEDVIPGQGRAIKATGERLVDASLDLSLAPSAQTHFYLAQSEAIYLRELGSTEWIERPIGPRQLPRYNDSVASLDEVWVISADSAPRERAVGLTVPSVSPDDPLAGEPVTVASYLRYAVPQPRRMPGGDRIDPVAVVFVENDRGESSLIDLRAFDAADTDNDLLVFRWIDDEAAFAGTHAGTPGRITISIPGTLIERVIDTGSLDLSLDNPPFTPIEGTPYSYRVTAIHDGLQVRESAPIVSVAVIEFQRGEDRFIRWVFDQPSLNRDQTVNPETDETMMVDFDAGIDAAYSPELRPAMLTLVAGPREDQLRLAATDPTTQARSTHDVAVGAPVTIGGGLTLTVREYAARSQEVEKPAIVPPRQRERNLDMQLRMIRVESPQFATNEAVWLQFNQYPFADETDALRGYPYLPTRVRLADGRILEMLFSRRSMPLPAPMRLDHFEVDYHVGGFDNSNASVRNWKSIVAFDRPGVPADPLAVSVNKPSEFEGLWFFQMAWDPPDPGGGSGGLAHTVLGVGNRQGVHMQLLGCAIAVVGMLYAFYVKPVLKRRQREAAYRVAGGEESPHASIERPAAPRREREAVSAGAGGSP